MVLNNGIFGISKTRINTKPFPRVSGAKLQFVMQKKTAIQRI